MQSDKRDSSKSLAPHLLTQVITSSKHTKTDTYTSTRTQAHEHKHHTTPEAHALTHAHVEGDNFTCKRGFAIILSGVLSGVSAVDADITDSITALAPVLSAYVTSASAPSWNGMLEALAAARPDRLSVRYNVIDEQTRVSVMLTTRVSSRDLDVIDAIDEFVGPFDTFVDQFVAQYGVVGEQLPFEKAQKVKILKTNHLFEGVKRGSRFLMRETQKGL